jgi:hypothetical protein
MDKSNREHRSCTECDEEMEYLLMNIFKKIQNNSQRRNQKEANNNKKRRHKKEVIF